MEFKTRSGNQKFMRVGLICEVSGTVRDAFIARGHDAISCDIEPTDSPGPHIKGDCRDYRSTWESAVKTAQKFEQKHSPELQMLWQSNGGYKE